MATRADHVCHAPTISPVKVDLKSSLVWAHLKPHDMSGLHNELKASPHPNYGHVPSGKSGMTANISGIGFVVCNFSILFLHDRLMSSAQIARAIT
jgi:hypothetical protein